MKRVTVSLLFASWVMSVVPSAEAGRVPGHRIQRVIVFGDSMTERRNVFARFAHPPGPYADGRPSNGPLYPEYVATTLGLEPPTASEDGGLNYSWSGATTGFGESIVISPDIPVPNVGEQIEAFVEDGHQFRGSDLVIFAIPHNGIVVGSRNPLTPTEIRDNFVTHIGRLRELGAENYLVQNVIAGVESHPGGSTVNSLIERKIRTWQREDDWAIDTIKFTELVFEIADSGGAYGITDFSPACNPCQGANPVLSPNPQEHLLWDEFSHFTTAFHQLLADRILSQISPLTELELADRTSDGILSAADLSCLSSIDARDAVLTALDTLPGDLDGNGDVSFVDFLLLSDNFGSNSSKYADGNVDLKDGVAFADFLILAANFERTPGNMAAAVPEPTSISLAAIGLLGAIFLIRRSRIRSTRESRSFRLAQRLENQRQHRM